MPQVNTTGPYFNDLHDDVADTPDDSRIRSHPATRQPAWPGSQRCCRCRSEVSVTGRRDLHWSKVSSLVFRHTSIPEREFRIQYIIITHTHRNTPEQDKIYSVPLHSSYMKGTLE